MSMHEEHTRVVETTPRRTVRTVDYEAPPHAVAEVDDVSAVAYDPYENRRNAAHRMVQAIWLVFGVIEALIAIRFVLRALGANPAAGFAQFIYGITNPLVAPFVGLFGTPTAANGSALEPHSIVALLVYALLGWLVAKVAWLLVGETRSAVTTRARTVDTRVR